MNLSSISDTLSFIPLEQTLLIGSGRLAKHLHYWFKLVHGSSLKLKLWNRSNTVIELEVHLKQVARVYLCISDQALLDFYNSYLKTYNHLEVIHFSGSFQHVKMISLHPLMTFSHDLYELEYYQKIYFAKSKSQPLNYFLPGFNNPSFYLASENQALYHALCVTSGNLPQLIWSKVLPLINELQIPDQALFLFLEKSLSNFQNLKSNAVTGPLIRNDLITQEKNINALKLKSPDLAQIYKSFQKENK